MAIIYVDDKNFEQEVSNFQKPKMVVFSAEWCPHCHRMVPVLEEVAKRYEGKVKVVKVNTDENLKTTQEFSISGIPSVLIFKKGQAVERLVGLMQKSQLVSNIEKHL